MKTPKTAKKSQIILFIYQELMKREHLFVTTKHFENCHKLQIFGVGKASINQFGLVSKGDKAFFLNKDKNSIVGPYNIDSDIFYNEEIIWQEKGGIDAYPYRVSLKSDALYAINISAFSGIVEENNIRLDSGDFGQKSVFTFLPKDTGIIEPSLIENGELVEKTVTSKHFHKNDITIKLAKSHGFTEHFLEYFILKEFDKYFGNRNFIPYNQLRINLLGSKIDIIALSSKEILVIELKKDTIKKEAVKQLQEYILWAKNNRILLEKFFKMTLDDALIHNFLIGSDVQKGIKTDRSFQIKKYSTSNDELSFLGGDQ